MLFSNTDLYTDLVSKEIVDLLPSDTVEFKIECPYVYKLKDDWVRDCVNRNQLLPKGDNCL